jgi:hypothetical protein
MSTAGVVTRSAVVRLASLSADECFAALAVSQSAEMSRPTQDWPV